MNNVAPLMSGHPGKKSLALFPGAFKPPHAAHLFAIDYLLGRPDVETVIVIISNRCRIIPGTTLALDAESAHVMLRTMLHCLDFPLDRVRIEIAEHRAVSHALDYFNSTDDGQKLLFCIGATDHASGDDRYDRLKALSRKSGVPAAVVTLPTETHGVRATHMRKALAGGAVHRSDFIDALPNGLSEMQKLVLWAECRSALQSVESIVRDKLCKSIAGLGVSSSEEMQVIEPDTVDPVFRLAQHDQPNRIIKYAGESVGKGSFAGPRASKPARRLAVEKRALNHVRKHLSERFSLPEVIRFDRAHRILVLTDATDRMTRLSSQLGTGDASVAGAAMVGTFLGELHSMDLPQSPFWGSLRNDKDHWDSLLKQLADTANASLRNRGLDDLCCDLHAQCESHVDKYVLHLDFRADNLALRSNSLFVANFERSACFGDPALDLATIMADYLCAAQDQSHSSINATKVRALLAGYHEVTGEPDKALPRRVFIYAAFLMLAQAGRDGNFMALSNRHQLAIKILRVMSATEKDTHLNQSVSQARSIAGLAEADLLQIIFRSNHMGDVH